MQAWDIVKVTQEGEHNGRAGKVIRVEGENITVELDETDTHESGSMDFLELELQLLGR